MSKIEIITSKDNAKIKEVIRLRNRQERDSQKLFIVEGYREFQLALESAFQLEEVFFCPELLPPESNRLIDVASKKGANVFQVNEKVFSKISFGERREGILAKVAESHLGLSDLVLPKDPLIVVAESLEKPGNLGAILRTCDAAAVLALIVCDSKTDIYNPNCVRSSMGAFFSVPVAQDSSQETIAWLKKNHFKIFLGLPEANTLYYKADFSGACAIVLGSEDRGLSRAWHESSQLKIKIPMNGKVDSLNVATAASILIFEALRQRKAK